MQQRELSYAMNGQQNNNRQVRGGGTLSATPGSGPWAAVLRATSPPVLKTARKAAPVPAGHPQAGCQGGLPPFSHGVKPVALLLCLLTTLTLPLHAQTVEVRQTSVPLGVVDQTGSVPLNSARQSVTVPETSSTYRFSYWTLNGARWVDASGAAENPASFVANGNTDLVAIYLPAAKDEDTDTLPDWWEMRYFGNLDQTPSGDYDTDGINNTTELAYNLHPLVPDLEAHGGVSRRRSESAVIIQNTAQYVRLEESSTPAGIVAQRRVVRKGMPVVLSNPPASTGGHYFTGWIRGAARFDLTTDNQPVTITPTEDLRLIARYVAATEDTDNDGLADWKEWLLFESLQYDGTSDPDVDGFTVVQEELRGFSTLASDTLVTGGISRRRSQALFADTTGRVSFRQTSDPATIIEQTDYLQPGSLVNLPDKDGHIFSGYQFSWWDINGSRQEDASGVALGGMAFRLSGPTTATAHYINPNLDSDGDGIKDWHEWTYYGTLGTSPTDDTDGDGFTYNDEITRGASPRAVDTLAHGGISRRRSNALFADTTGRLMVRQASDPTSIIDQTDYYRPGTIVTAPDKSGNTFGGYLFSWWDMNGERQTDASGVALGGFAFRLDTTTNLLAHYIDPNLDSDGDGIKDWHEWTYYGTLVTGAGADSDVDGFTYEEEIARAQSPRVVDVLAHGGISRRRGNTATITPLVTATAPEVGSLTSQYVTTTTARISALVNSMSAATNANFEFGTTQAYGHSVTSESILNGFTSDFMGAALTNLQPNTTYYYRVVATNTSGSTTSAASSFTTMPITTSFDQWMRIYSVASPTGDDDGDGIRNIVEFAFGMNPRSNIDTWRMPRIDLVGQRLRLRVTEPQGVGGIVYGAQWTEDLSSWFDMPDSGVGTYHEFLTPRQLVGAPNLFVRWVIRTP